MSVKPSTKKPPRRDKVAKRQEVAVVVMPEFRIEDEGQSVVVEMFDGASVKEFKYIDITLAARQNAENEKRAKQMNVKMMTMHNNVALLEAENQRIRADLDAATLLLQEEREQIHERNQPVKQCTFCLKTVSDGWYVTCSLCQSHTHFSCITRGPYHNSGNVKKEHCADCSRKDQEARMKPERDRLIKEYRDAHSKAAAPSGPVMQVLCHKLELTPKSSLARLHHAYQWSSADVDDVYSYYKTITPAMLIEKNLKVQDLINMKLTMANLVDDFGVTPKDLIAFDPKHLDRHPRSLELQTDQIGILQDDCVKFLDIGFDHMRVRRRIYSFSTISAMNLRASSLCILGFTAIELIMCGLNKDRIRELNCSETEWIVYLGLDRETLLLLGIRDKDFAGILKCWNKDVLVTKLGIKDQELSTYFRRADEPSEGSQK